MTDYRNALNLPLSNADAAGRARDVVLAATAWSPTPTTQVAYAAANRVLVVAELAVGEAFVAQLPDALTAYLAVPAAQTARGDGGGNNTRARVFRCAELTIDGHLGRFRARCRVDDGSDDGMRDLGEVFAVTDGCFDQVVDCSATPIITAAVKPPGYHCAPDAQTRAGVAEMLPQWIGEFEKPKYFAHHADLCAHGRSGVRGCTRCLDACPTGAIHSLGDAIEVDSHLCQGGGVCAAVCPSGAIEYIHPPSGEQIELVRALLFAMREQHHQCGIEQCGITLLIFGNEHGRAEVEAAAAQLDGHVMPLMLEEIGAADLALVTAALAYGAGRVCLYAPHSVSAQVREALRGNVAVIESVLAQTGCTTHRAEIIDQLDSLINGKSPPPSPRAAPFAPTGDKRAIIRAALSFFAEIADAPPPSATLPDAALFGRVNIDAPKCTLCMGCASVCPANALHAGGDTPALRFIEANCVQCGICTRACPEDALTLQARLLFDAVAARTEQTLKEEEALHCPQCGKAFATRSMIDRMHEKLKDHWMFADEQAMRRLRLCEECRVKDLFAAENRAAGD